MKEEKTEKEEKKEFLEELSAIIYDETIEHDWQRVECIKELIWKEKYGATFQEFVRKIKPILNSGRQVELREEDVKRYTKKIVEFCYDAMYEPIFDKGYKKAKMENPAALRLKQKRSKLQKGTY